MLTVVVSLRVLPGMEKDFVRHMTDNATASLRDEAGCLRFDVLRDTTDPHAFLLYETYADADAFHRIHLTAPHFLVWKARAADIVEPGSQMDRFFSSVDTVAG